MKFRQDRSFGSTEAIRFVCDETGASFEVDVGTIELEGSILSFETSNVYMNNVDERMFRRHTKEAMLDLLKLIMEKYDER